MTKLQTLGRHNAIGIIIENCDWTSKARRVALEAVGLSDSAVEFTGTVESDYAGGKLYEVTFSGSELNYDCFIDADSWEVVGLDKWPVAR